MTNTEQTQILEVPARFPCLCGVIVFDANNGNDDPNAPVWFCEECGADWTEELVADWDEMVGDFDGEIVWE